MSDSSRASLGDYLALGSGIVMVVGFFMPWITVFDLSASGWTLLDLSNRANTANPGSASPAWFFLILIAGACGVLTSVWGLWSPATRRTAATFSLICGMLGITPFIVLLTQSIQAAQSLGQGTQGLISQNAGLALDVIGLGLWLTILGAIGLIVQRLFPRREIITEPAPTAYRSPGPTRSFSTSSSLPRSTNPPFRLDALPEENATERSVPPTWNQVYRRRKRIARTERNEDWRIRA